MSNDDIENASVIESLPAIADNTLIQIAEQAEKRMQAVKTIKRVALALTNANDWVNENGKPYMMSSAGEKIARFLGVSWRIDEPRKETFSDGHYEWSYSGTFSFAGATITAIGARNSRDKFFSRRNNADVPPSEIDSSDVKKAAYTNLIANGVTRLIGLRNLTWDDLSEYAKINQTDIAGVTYKKKDAPGQWIETDKKPRKEEADRLKTAGLGKWRKNPDNTFTWLEKATGKPQEPPKPEAKAEQQPAVEEPLQAGTASDKPKSATSITKAQRGKLFVMMGEQKMTDDAAKEFYHFVLGKQEATAEWASEFISNFDNYLELYQDSKRGAEGDKDGCL